MIAPKKQSGRKRAPSVVVCGRITPLLAQRLDWLTKNDDETNDRTEGVRKGVEAYVKTREDACRKKGLTPIA